MRVLSPIVVVFGVTLSMGASLGSAIPSDGQRPSRIDVRNAQQPGGGSDTEAVARGHAQFDRVCGRCHPHANRDIGPRLIGLNWSEARVRQQVRQGHRTMRPIPPSRMSDDQLNDVIAYLRTIGTVQ